ncbi:MAG: acetylglutamate kinase [Gemmatimonadaceae bacterium]
MMRVAKIGGRAQSDPVLAAAIKSAWNARPGGLCIVHGGGDEVSALQRAMGKQPQFVGGRRVTSASDLDLLRMVLSGSVNKRIVNALITAGVPAVGLSGEDGGLIEAERIDSSALGFAGRPSRINIDLLLNLLNAGYMPVISPVAYDASDSGGGTLNVNGDDAAAAIAVALSAVELLLIADIEGVRDETGATLEVLSVDQAMELVTKGVAGGGMAAKLESAHHALEAGIERVRICGLEGLLNSERGTLITQSAGVTS